jgi:hypothetical protein
MDLDSDQEPLAPLPDLMAQAQALAAQMDAMQAQGQDSTEVEGELYVVMQRIQEAQAQADAERRGRVQSLGMGLLAELQKRKGERQLVELRWLRDNQYEDDKEKQLAQRQFGSKAFVPLTRRIVNVVEARLGDLLFPVDDTNFGVEPSPVPELSKAAELAAKLPDDQQVETPEGPVPVGAVRQSVGQLLDKASDAAAAMKREIDDQLQQCDYPTEARRAIRDGLVLGIGVIKGPTVYLRTKKQWEIAEDGTATMTLKEDTSPQSARVDPWLFFPETAAKGMKDNGSTFEGHPMSAAQFAGLATTLPDVDKEAIREELMQPASDTTDTNVKATQEAAGVAGVTRNSYMVWEYHGPISADDLRACGCDLPDDPLMVYTGVVFFTDRGRVLKAQISVMDGSGLPYHVWSWQPDANSIFGYGLPYELRDMQESANSSWRAAQDNMGLSVGGMLVVDTNAIKPADGGNYDIAPNKVFHKREAGGRVEDYLTFVEIPSKVNDLLAVFNLSKQLCDEIGGPMLAMQGQDAPSYVQTATGMGIAYNAASVWMRRGVKGWDDFITIPQISQYIDWNMRHNPKREIKGDLNPIARGTSHLLESEGQITRLQTLMTMASQVGIPLRKAINQLREMARAMRLDEQKLLPDDAEISQMEEQQRNAQPKLTPEQERLKIREMELADRKEDREMNAQLAAQTNQLRMAELAQKEGLSVEEIRAKYEMHKADVIANLTDRREQRQHDAQALNAEIATRMQTGAGV